MITCGNSFNIMNPMAMGGFMPGCGMLGGFGGGMFGCSLFGNNNMALGFNIANIWLGAGEMALRSYVEDHVGESRNNLPSSKKLKSQIESLRQKVSDICNELDFKGSTELMACSGDSTDQTRAAKIAQAQTEVKALEEQIATLKAQYEEALLEEQDGSCLNRISENKYNAKFAENGTLKEDAEFDKRDLKRAILNYSKAATPEDKAKYKQQFADVWAKVEGDMKPDKRKSYAEVYKLIMGQPLV